LKLFGNEASRVRCGHLNERQSLLRAIDSRYEKLMDDHSSRPTGLLLELDPLNVLDFKATIARPRHGDVPEQKERIAYF
jgi:hypothetical protein